MLRGSSGGGALVEQEPDRGGLPSAVRPKEAVYFAAPDLRVEPVERGEVAESLDLAGRTGDDQLAERDCGVRSGAVAVVGNDISSHLSSSSIVGSFVGILRGVRRAPPRGRSRRPGQPSGSTPPARASSRGRPREARGTSRTRSAASMTASRTSGSSVGVAEPAAMSCSSSSGDTFYQRRKSARPGRPGGPAVQVRQQLRVGSRDRRRARRSRHSTQW